MRAELIIVRVGGGGFAEHRIGGGGPGDASKAGLLGLTKTLALEYPRKGVTVKVALSTTNAHEPELW